MKKIFLLIVTFCLIAQSAYCEQYDSSIDNELRKQYNVEQLPALPKVSPSSSSSPVSPAKLPQKKDNTSATVEKISNYSGKTYTIKGGTKITLLSKSKLVDWNAVGTKISFVSQNSITTKEGAVIPAGTVFKATVTNSHQPQITGNGGLIQLKVNEIYFNGAVSFINTKLSEVNSKNVFGQKLKGKRKYWQNVAKAMTPGKKTFKVMNRAAKPLLPIPIVNILSIVPYTIGGVVYIVNLPIAPIASVFMKGAHITLPANTAFIITVSGNNQIRG